MGALALPANATLVPLIQQRSKREEIETLIEAYAAKAMAMDAGIGLAGFIPIPGAGIAAMVGAIVAPAVVIYQPMAREIAAIYTRVPDDATDAEVLRGTVMGGALDVATAFGTEFFTEIATEVLQDVGWGAALGFIPILGGIASIGLDVVIARMMTWRVGLMVALYNENGCKWVGSRRETYEIVRRSNKAERYKEGQPHPTIASVVRAATGVEKNQELALQMIARSLHDLGASKDDLREALIKRGFDAALVDAALSRL